MSITASPATVRVQSMARVSVQPVFGAGVRVTPCRFAFSSRLHTTKSLGQSRPRQMITMAENPISKAVEGVKEAAEDFGDEVKSNAEGTAKKTEAAYKDANPEESDEKPPTDQYRSTELKNSDNKYTPKSDPKK